MVRVESDHVNWAVVVILVALAILLAFCQSAGYGETRRTVAADRIPIVGLLREATEGLTWQGMPEEQRTAPESWSRARDLYWAGRTEEASELLERVVASYPYDIGARMWAGMAALRAGHREVAVRHWEAAWQDGTLATQHGFWPAIALAAVLIESQDTGAAAQLLLPLEHEVATLGAEAERNPVLWFYAARLYEQLACAAPAYLDAVEESLGVRFSPTLAEATPGAAVSPRSKSWLVFLTERSLRQTIFWAESLDLSAPAVPESATAEPWLVPTVGDLLDALGSADFASQARRKLRALELYESRPAPESDIFDSPNRLRRGQFIA